MQELTTIEQFENQTDIWELFDSVPKGNSQFQIKQMILNEYGPERAYRMAVLQLREKYEALKKAEIERDRLRLKIAKGKKDADKLKDEDKELKLLDVAEHELDLKLQEGLVKDAFVEVQAYIDFLNEAPEVTRESFEAAELKYWQTRLSAKAQHEALERVSGISSGLLETFENIGGGAYEMVNGVTSHVRKTLPSPDNG